MGIKQFHLVCTLIILIVVFVVSPLLYRSFMTDVLIPEALINQTGFVQILLALTGCNNVYLPH